jgi:rhodanese-related sulfurtransferase
MNILKLIFGEKVDLRDVISKGAIIVDVRSKGEYQSGHLKNSINIPVDTLEQNIKKLKKDKPVITCCASGARSGSAMRILKANGFEQVYNGGGWTSLRKYM